MRRLTIKIQDEISITDAVECVNKVLKQDVWNPVKSGRVDILKAIDSTPLAAYVTDLNPRTNDPNRHFMVEPLKMLDKTTNNQLVI